MVLGVTVPGVVVVLPGVVLLPGVAVPVVPVVPAVPGVWVVVEPVLFGIVLLGMVLLVPGVCVGEAPVVEPGVADGLAVPVCPVAATPPAPTVPWLEAPAPADEPVDPAAWGVNAAISVPW